MEKTPQVRIVERYIQFIEVNKREIAQKKREILELEEESRILQMVINIANTTIPGYDK